MVIDMHKYLIFFSFLIVGTYLVTKNLGIDIPTTEEVVEIKYPDPVDIPEPPRVDIPDPIVVDQGQKEIKKVIPKKLVRQQPKETVEKKPVKKTPNLNKNVFTELPKSNVYGNINKERTHRISSYPMEKNQRSYTFSGADGTTVEVKKLPWMK